MENIQDHDPKTRSEGSDGSKSRLTIPASSETSIVNANAAATRPVAIVLLTGTWLCLFMSEKNDGSSPSLAIAIKIRG